MGEIRRLGHARITLQDKGGWTMGEIEIDGARVEGGIRSLTLTAGANQAPMLELNTAIAEFDDIEVEAVVRYGLTKSTREALIALGWTPPKGHDDG
jgi:hypothetical protein